jgi:hypothetical protein
VGESEEAGKDSRQLRIRQTNLNGRYQANRDPKLAVRKLFDVAYRCEWCESAGLGFELANWAIKTCRQFAPVN